MTADTNHPVRGISRPARAKDVVRTAAVRQAHPVASRLVTDLHGLRALEPAWWALLERAACGEPTKTPTWVKAWWNVFGDAGRRELRVLVVEEAGQVVGVVPLLRRWVLREAVIPVATLELLG